MVEVKENRRHKRKGLFIGVGAAIVVIVAIVILILTGFLYVGVKSPAVRISANYKICNDADVKNYNELMNSEPIKDYMEQIDELYDNIKNRAHNDQDATCQYILYSIAFFEDKDETNTFIDSLKKLNSKGEYPDNNISNLMSIDDLGD